MITLCYVHKSVMEELKRIIDYSEITKEDEALWPLPDRVDKHISSTTSKIVSLIDVNQSRILKAFEYFTIWYKT
uniref:Uncharacterized protein n=1 Tax=Cebus imitator TaxID=2715852 RepID=A0A2K5P9D2_CEBIM